MTIRIHAIRLSRLWTEVSPALLEDPAPAAPMAFLGRASTFVAEFERIRRGESAHPLSLPWPRPSGQRFWHYYLGERRPGDIPGHPAWKALVPLRLTTPPLQLSAPGVEQLFQDAFVVPYGIAWAITGTFRGDWSLEEAVREVHSLVRDRCFSVKKGDQTRAVTLREAAGLALDELRAKVLGAGAPAGKQSVDPFSLVTVLSGERDAQDRLIENSEEHRSIEALASFSASWRVDPLPPLSERRLDVQRASDTRVLYAQRAARVVWFPALFAHREEPIHSLGCYHRNLFFCSLQVQCLCELASMVVERIDNGVPGSTALTDCGRFAAGLLGRLYGGDPSVYRTESARAQIVLNKKKPILDGLRAHHGMPPLA